MTNYSKAEQRSVIAGVTIGNILEWYEIYLYVYWAPVLSKLFFSGSSNFSDLTSTYIIFAIGFLARPLGGVFFGRLGDRIGRKKSLILSIISMTCPTIAMGFLPTYGQIGIYAPLLLAFLRFLQSFPSGGELPGAFCFLYESAGDSNKRFMCSWGAVGNQIGILFSMIECFFLEKYLSAEDLMNWGWRISFLVGGVIGLLGFYLRHRLHETPLFLSIRKHEEKTKPIFQVIKEYKMCIYIGILFCTLDASGFYLLSTYFPLYFNKVLGTTYTQSILVSMLCIALTTIPLPFFGLIGDKFNNKTLLISCSSMIIFLIFPLYFALSVSSLIIAGVTVLIFMLLFACITALIPFLLANLFPTEVRFTCLGITFNLADSVIGGLSPIIALSLFHYTENQASFCWFVLLSAVISFYSYLKFVGKKTLTKT